MTFDSHHHLLVSHLMQLNARVANLFGISQSTCEPPSHLMMMWGSSAALLYIITVGTDLELMNLLLAAKLLHLQTTQSATNY